jgi:hypothetical protein
MFEGGQLKKEMLAIASALKYEPADCEQLLAPDGESHYGVRFRQDRLVGDAILRIIETKADRFASHALAAFGVVREKLAKMQPEDILIMSC